MSLLLDTHAAIWYLRQSTEISRTALKTIREAVTKGKPLFVSAISLVEAIYLVERGRIPLSAIMKLEAALKDPASGIKVTPVDAEVAEAVYKIPRRSVPDMPDRIICATALCRNLQVVPRDARIQSSGIKAVW